MKRFSKKFLFFYGIAVLLFLLFTLGPIVWTFVISITPQIELMSETTSIFPKKTTLENYSKLIFNSSQQGRLFRLGLGNSVKASVLSLFIGIPIAMLCAYALSRLKFAGAKKIRNVLLFTMAIPVFATIIPLYSIFSRLRVLDNLLSLVLVYMSSFLPVTIWLLVSFLQTLPKELEEAAWLDGCSRLQTLLRVIVPVTYPVLFAAILIVFISTWNQFQIPLILASSYATKPIAVVISEFVTKSTIDYGLMSAGGILAILPPVVIAIIFRKFLITGIVGGATKA